MSTPSTSPAHIPHIGHAARTAWRAVTVFVVTTLKVLFLGRDGVD